MIPSGFAACTVPRSLSKLGGSGSGSGRCAGDNAGAAAVAASGQNTVAAGGRRVVDDGFGGCWLETKVAFSLQTARPSVFASRRAAAEADAQARMLASGLFDDANSDDNGEAMLEEEKQEKQHHHQQQPQQLQQQFDPATRKFLEVYMFLLYTLLILT